MSGPQRFLTAEWRWLAMLNWKVAPELLQSRVPKGTELDAWHGATFVSVVGFLFRDTRVLGIPSPSIARGGPCAAEAADLNLFSVASDAAVRHPNRKQTLITSGGRDMNSIHANQPEDHRDDLVAGEAVAKLKELVKDGQNGFFRTTTASNGTSVRPMNVRQVDDAGNLWFLSAVDSFKNDELEENAEVELYFQGAKHSDFLHLNGHATITKDRAKIEELWEPTIRTWFTEGKDDPRISVIKVAPEDGYYWDSKHGGAIAGIKMLIGAATGRTLDDSIEGEMTM